MCHCTSLLPWQSVLNVVYSCTTFQFLASSNYKILKCIGILYLISLHKANILYRLSKLFCSYASTAVLHTVVKLANGYNLFHLGYYSLQRVAIFVTAQCTIYSFSYVALITAIFSEMATRFFCLGNR